MMVWNVIISVFQDGYRRALRALGELGQVERSPYHNVLIMTVSDPMALLDTLERRTQAEPALYDAISRVAPAMQCFQFRNSDEFREGVLAVLEAWLPRLGGRSFHVRLHTRGFKHDWRTPDAERYFDDWVLSALKDRGAPGSISFSNPDVVIAIDTIDERSGISIWTSQDLKRYHLLRPD